MRFITENGRLSLTDGDGNPLFSGLSSGVNVKDGDRDDAILTCDGWTVGEDGVLTSGPASVTTAADSGGIRFYSEYTSGDDIKRCEEFVVLRGKLTEGIVRFLAPFVRDANGSRTNEMLTSVESLPLTFDTSKTAASTSEKRMISLM